MFVNSPIVGKDTYGSLLINAEKNSGKGIMARWKGFKNKAERCYYCWRTTEYLRRQGIYMTVDHVLPKCKGGTNEWENLVTACERCNNMKGESLEWYEGCVAIEAFNHPEWFRDMLLAEEEARRPIPGKRKNGKERMERDSEAAEDWKRWSLGRYDF